MSNNTLVSNNTFTTMEQQPLPGQIFANPQPYQWNPFPPLYQLAPAPQLAQQNAYLMANQQLVNPQNLIQPLPAPQIGPSFGNVMQQHIEDFYQKTIVADLKYSRTFKEFMQWKECLEVGDIVNLKLKPPSSWGPPPPWVLTGFWVRSHKFNILCIIESCESFLCHYEVAIFKTDLITVAF